MYKMQLSVVVALTSILLYSVSFAEERVFDWRVFRQEDGLASNLISDVVQTTDGNVWFATLGAGVSRYDGRHWKTFGPPDGLPGDVVSDLFEDSDGTLWAAAEPGLSTQGVPGVARFTGDRWEPLEMPLRLESARVQQIESFGTGICFATEQGILHYDGLSVSRVDSLRSPASVGSIVWDGDGGLWTASAGRGLPHQLYQREAFDSAAHSGLSRYDRNTGSWEGIPVPATFLGAEVLAMTQTPDGRVWFGTADQGIYRYDGTTWLRLSQLDGLPSNRIQAMRPDALGRVWLGTPAGAVLVDDRFGDAIIETFTENDGLPNDYVTSIWVGRDGTVWIGTRGGAARYGPTGWVHYHDWPGADDGMAVVAWIEQALLVLTEQALYEFDGDRWTELFRFGKPVRPIKILRRDDGRVWAVTSDRVIVKNDQNWKQTAVSEMLVGPILSADIAREGLWLGGPDGLQLTQDSGKSILVSRRGPVLDIVEGNDAVWIGVDSTLYRGSLRGGFHPVAMPVAGPVSSLMVSDNEQIWVSSITGGVVVGEEGGWTSLTVEGADLTGVRRIRRTPTAGVWLASIFDGAIRSDGSNAVRYSRSSGLPDTRVWDVAEDEWGGLWFVTASGIARYVPDDAAPETRILDSRSTLDYHDHMTLRFAADDLWSRHDSDRIFYSWRIDGGDWSPFESRDWSMLKDMAPGRHLFEVRAMDEDFNIDASPASMTFEVLPPLWLQERFYLPVLVLLIALGIAVEVGLKHRRRVRVSERRLLDNMTTELQRAHDMQLGLLPERSVTSGVYEVSGRCIPANHVGGDHYNYWLEDSGRSLGFGAADVSGKAMAAAVRAVQLSEICHFTFPGSEDPRAALTKLDGILLDRLEDSEFVTCCFGYVDTLSGRLRVANAGHPYPVHFKHARRDAVLLDLPSLPLGVTLPKGLRRPPSYIEAALEPGDFLVVYSDGVTELGAPSDGAYGDDRLLAAVRQFGTTTGSADGMVSALVDDLMAFKGDQLQTDDISIVAISRSLR